MKYPPKFILGFCLFTIIWLAPTALSYGQKGNNHNFHYMAFPNSVMAGEEDAVLQICLVNEGNWAAFSANICLNQQWLQNAACHFLFMADLFSLEKAFGPRAYRHLMMEAGRLGQAIYLGATALGLGCCGIGALYDYEAQEMLDLSDNTFLLYLVAAGPIRRTS